MGYEKVTWAVTMRWLLETEAGWLVFSRQNCVFLRQGGDPRKITTVGEASACGSAVWDTRWGHASGDREIEKFPSVCGGEVD